MNLQTLLAFVFLQTGLFAQTKNPFLSLKFDSVIMYDYRPDGEKSAMIISPDGKLISTVTKTAKIDGVTSKDLSRKIGEKKSYGGTTAFCFDPHLGIVYYSKSKVVAHVSICFECNRLRSSLDIPAQKQGRVGEGKDAYYIADGLSKTFRSFLNTLVKKYKFSHSIEPGSAFDE